MALFKSKTSRRSSSSSYTSTLTTLFFLALCALAIWMLSSNSVVSPDEGANTRVALDNSELTNNDLSATVEDSVETSSKVIEEPVDTTSKISDDSADGTTKITDPKQTQAFGDNPGHLPEDAIKSDDKNPNLNVNNEPQNDHISNADTQISEESSLTQAQAASETISDKKPEEIHEELETVSVKENQQQSITERPQEDAQSFDPQEAKKQKEIIDERLKQLREDKGETVEKDQIAQQPQEIHEEQQPKQDEHPDSAIDTSQQEPQLSQTEQSSELSLEDPKKKKTQKIEGESEENNKPKSEKKKKKRKDGNNSKSLPKGPKKTWSTQADDSKKEKDGQTQARTWELCNITAGADYIPCLDNEAVIRKLHSRRHFEHRERHCPEEAPACLVPLPQSYKRSIEWPDSRDKVNMRN